MSQRVVSTTHIPRRVFGLSYSRSALVVWAQEQLKSFAEMFRKQVYTSDVEPGVVQEAIAIARIQGRKVYLNRLSFV